MVGGRAKYLARFALPVLWIALSTGPVAAQTGMVVPGTVYSPPLRPLYVLTGDFNGDNIQDLIVLTDEGTGMPANAYVLLGNGDGTFQPAKSYPLGVAGFSSPGTPALGNLVLTGHVQDLVVPIAVSNTVNVLLGKGDGTFSPFVSYSVDNQPTAAIVADTDGTAYPELAVVANGTGNHASVSILLGHGDGTFAPASIIPLTAPFPSSVTWGYFRKNVFDTDLAIGTAAGVAVLLGKGQGTFQPEVDYPLPSRVTSILSGDFNGDGLQDLAVTQGSVVSILLGNGDGTFQAAKDYPVGNGAQAIFDADFNGDHHDDLVVANHNDNTFSVLLGNGDGTFQPALSFAVNGIGPSSIGVGDFNSDGAPDVVITTPTGSTSGSLGSAFVFLNTRGTSETVSCSPNPVQFGQNTTCNVTLSASLTGRPIPSGNIVVNISNAALPPVCSGTLDSTGKMQCQGGSFLGMGAWSVRADYSGDKNYNPGSFNSSAVLTVDELNFTSPSPVSIAAGQTAHFSVTLSDNLAYAGSVSLACTGAPMGAACSVPASVNLPAQINAAVSTTPRSMAAVPNVSPWLWSIAVAVVFLPTGSRRKRGIKRFAIALPLCLLLFIVSCGGGNSSNASNPNGTPAGTYTMTLTATAGGLKTSTPLIVNVQ